MFEAYNLTFKTYIRKSFFHFNWNWHHCLSPIFNSHHFWTFPYELSTKNQLGHQPWLALGGENPGAQVSLFDAAGVAALGTLPCFGGRLGSGSNRSQVRAGIRKLLVRELPFRNAVSIQLYVGENSSILKVPEMKCLVMIGWKVSSFVGQQRWRTLENSQMMIDVGRN